MWRSAGRGEEAGGVRWGGRASGAGEVLRRWLGVVGGRGGSAATGPGVVAGVNSSATCAVGAEAGPMGVGVEASYAAGDADDVTTAPGV